MTIVGDNGFIRCIENPKLQLPEVWYYKTPGKEAVCEIPVYTEANFNQIVDAVVSAERNHWRFFHS